MIIFCKPQNIFIFQQKQKFRFKLVLFQSGPGFTSLIKSRVLDQMENLTKSGKNEMNMFIKAIGKKIPAAANMTRIERFCARLLRLKNSNKHAVNYPVLIELFFPL